jgi:hypothetical protein
MTDRDAVLEARAAGLAVHRIGADWYEVESATEEKRHTVRVTGPDPAGWTCDCRGGRRYCSHNRAARMHRDLAWAMNARGGEE